MILDPHADPDAAQAYALHTTRAIAVNRADGQPYTLHISWPEGQAPASGWPVVYMLDGETFGIAREIMRYQCGSGAQPLATPHMLVAIGYPGPSRRHADYGPAPAGAGHHFRQFLIEHVCPLIQRQFDVDASRQTLMGHSLGGLFVLETLFEQFTLPGRGAFARYVASSPSVWWQNGHLPARADSFLAALSATPACAGRPAPSPGTCAAVGRPLDRAACGASPAIDVWVSAAQYDQDLSPAEQALPQAECEALAHTRAVRAMVQGNRTLASQLAEVDGLNVSFHVLDQETHRSAWPRAIGLAMRGV